MYLPSKQDLLSLDGRYVIIFQQCFFTVRGKHFQFSFNLNLLATRFLADRADVAAALWRKELIEFAPHVICYKSYSQY